MPRFIFTQLRHTICFFAGWSAGKENANSKVRPMQASHNVKNERSEQPDVLQGVSEQVKRAAPDRLRDAVGNAAVLFIGVVLIVTANGCLATRSWVQDQLTPVTGRLNETDAKADRALAGLQNLSLERKLVLDDSGHAPTFAIASAALSPNAKREVSGFVQDLDAGSTGAASGPGLLFVVAGHTDRTGPRGYNYKLGQRRAQSVAGYLVSKEGIDPMQVRVVSYGASKPIADNRTASGRRRNRRVEILVYQEKIVAGR